MNDIAATQFDLTRPTDDQLQQLAADLTDDERLTEVKTDDWRPSTEQQAQHILIVKEAPVNFREFRRRLGAELSELGPEAFDPATLEIGIGSSRTMAEQIDVERQGGSFAYLRDHRFRPGRVCGANRNRSKSARLADGRSHCRRGNARHRRLDDR